MVKKYSPVSAEEAVKVIKSGDNIHVHSVALAPRILLDAMCDRAKAGEIKDVFLRHLHTEGEAPYIAPEFANIFHLESYFVGHNVRKATQSGQADYIPVFLSETQKLIREGYTPVDVAMIQVSTPDKHGYVSLGTSVDATLAAVQNAKTVIAVVNPKVPRTMGDAIIRLNQIDIFVEHESPLFLAPPPPLTDTDIKIGEHVAALVEDGATLQMGIGGIPNAVLNMLGNHKDLGIHTEMFSDGVVPLVEKGVINGSKKALDKNKIVATFLMGTNVTYDFVDDNPEVLMMDVGYTNAVNVIRQNPKVTAINSAIQIDLTGQVCADSIGTKFYSGVGGQIDFIRGAGYSEGGKPIIALPSTTRNGQSKIAPTLIEGAGVVSTRSNVHWVVTEFGAVNLYGKAFQKRAKALISIAHPDHQEALDKAAFERFGSHYYYVKENF